jgi:hypothetical protein
MNSNPDTHQLKDVEGKDIQETFINWKSKVEKINPEIYVD